MQILDNFLQDKYQKKRAIIIAIFVVIFLTIILFFYSWLKPKATCMDGKQNQNEEGVDCGGVCPNKCEKITAQDLTSQESGFVPSGAVNKYDLYARVSNPNNIYGSSEFQYTFKLKDPSGAVIATKSGLGFILPGESKYVVEPNIDSAAEPASLEFNVTDPKWVEFKDYFEKPQLRVVNKQYNQITSGVGFSEAIGLLKNESPFDFSLIRLEVILKDPSDKVVGINSTEMRTVKAGENRDFKAIWMNRFPGDVINVEVQPEVNIFDSESFATKYFQTGQAGSYR